MTPQQIDRWLLNVIFRRSRIFRIDLADCCDEFGNGFGAEGSHFFVRALAGSETYDAVFAFLKSYYARHPIRSFNDVIGHDIGDDAGHQYFCPWESARVRPLARFEGSHKAGPTPDEALRRIVARLLDVLASIRARGFRQFSLLDGFLRVIAVVDRTGHRRYLIRDGQHRAAAVSHLGREAVWATYDADFWTPSPLYRLLAHHRGNGGIGNLSPQEVREDAVDDWPHVREGRVTRDEALAYFHALFGDLELAAE